MNVNAPDSNLLFQAKKLKVYVSTEISEPGLTCGYDMVFEGKSSFTFRTQCDIQQVYFSIEATKSCKLSVALQWTTKEIKAKNVADPNKSEMVKLIENYTDQNRKLKPLKLNREQSMRMKRGNFIKLQKAKSICVMKNSKDIEESQWMHRITNLSTFKNQIAKVAKEKVMNDQANIWKSEYRALTFIQHIIVSQYFIQLKEYV